MKNDPNLIKAVFAVAGRLAQRQPLDRLHQLLDNGKKLVGKVELSAAIEQASERLCDCSIELSSAVRESNHNASPMAQQLEWLRDNCDTFELRVTAERQSGWIEARAGGDVYHMSAFAIENIEDEVADAYLCVRRLVDGSGVQNRMEREQ